MPLSPHCLGAILQLASMAGFVTGSPRLANNSLSSSHGGGVGGSVGGAVVGTGGGTVVGGAVVGGAVVGGGVGLVVGGRVGASVTSLATTDPLPINEKPHLHVDCID